MKIGSKLKSIRLAHGLTGTDLATLSSTSQSTISEIENNRRSPSIDTLDRICKVLGITISELLEEENIDPTFVKLRDLYTQLSQEEKNVLIQFLTVFINQRKTTKNVSFSEE